MSKLDEILDWYTRPVNKDEFLSSRKKAVKDLFKALIIESDSDIKTIFKRIEEL